MMSANRVAREEDIVDFEQRYSRICADVQDLETRLKDHAEHYRRLKKLEYSLQLAQEPEFVYGPSYPGFGFQFKDREEEEQPVRLWDKPEMQQKEQENMASEERGEVDSDKKKGVQKE